MKKLIWLLLPLVYGCAMLAEKEDPFAIWLEQNTLYFDGYITKVSAEAFMAFDKTTATKLVVNSKGGDVEAAIDMAYWVYEQEIELEVAQYCASSCANYLFPAASKKYLHQDSVLAYHGGAFQKNFLKLPEADPVRVKEEAFFQTIGVPGLITTYGQEKAVKKLYGEAWYDIGFYYEPEDMAKVGIDNVVLLDGSWDWRVHHRDMGSFFAAKIDTTSELWQQLLQTRQQQYQQTQQRLLALQ